MDGRTDRQTGGQAAIRTAAGETKPAEGKGSPRDTIGLSTKLYWFIYLFIYLTKTSKPYTAYQHERILQIPLFGGIRKGNIRERGRVGPAAAGPRWERQRRRGLTPLQSANAVRRSATVLMEKIAFSAQGAVWGVGDNVRARREILHQSQPGRWASGTSPRCKHQSPISCRALGEFHFSIIFPLQRTPMGRRGVFNLSQR